MKVSKSKVAPAKSAEDTQTTNATGEAQSMELVEQNQSEDGPKAASIESADKTTTNPLDGLKVVMVKAGELKPNSESSRLYGADIPPTLLASIEDEGIQTPLTVDRETGQVIAGNTRLMIATKLGIPEVPVIYVDGNVAPLALVATNVAREKTVEMKVREFIIYENQEKREAKTRRKSKVLTVGPKKSRDRAAAKVGLSASSLEMGREVVRALDGLEAKKDPDRANRLRAKLNEDGIKPAHELAISLGVIKSKFRSKADEAPKQKKEMRSDTETGEGDAKDSEEWDHNAQAENHVRALQTLTTFCQEGEASELDAATKKRLGEAFAAASQAMTDAGILVPASLK